MNKEQLLTFIPGPEEKYASTNKIAKDAKINHYVAQRLLTELYAMDRPLVDKFEFGKNRDFILWRRSKLDKEALEKALKVNPKDRDTKEHKIVCMNKYGGNWNRYIVEILNN